MKTDHRINEQKIAFALIFCTLLVCLMASCKKKQEPVLDEFDAPEWTPIDENKSETMTIVATLSAELLAKSDSTDMLAAFVDDECRGVTTLLDGKFYLLVYGNAEDNQQPLRLRYYQTQTKHLYEENSTNISFIPGERIGAETPYTLQLNPVAK